MALSGEDREAVRAGGAVPAGPGTGPADPGFRLIIPFIDVQLRNLQSLVEIGVDKNTTVVFPAPLMITIAELGSFLAASWPPPARRRWPPPDLSRRPPLPPTERP